MRIFKPQYKRKKDGNKQKTQKYYLEFRDVYNIVRRLPAFSDKRQSQSLARNIERLRNETFAGLGPDETLTRWLDTLPERILKKLIISGFIDGQRAQAIKPLNVHITDYIKILQGRGRSKDYISRIENRLKKLISDCHFLNFRDITKSKVEMYLGSLRKNEYSDTSIGHYLDALKAFLSWAEEDGRIIKNPIAKIKKPSRDSEKKGVLTAEQFIHLIKTTFQKNTILCNKHIGRTTGQKRATLYVLAGTTGLRRKELLNLRWENIHISPKNSFIIVPKKLAKNSKGAEQPLPPATVAILSGLKADIKPNDTERVFSSFGQWINTAELLRADLQAAGLPLKDRDGNKICFHSLRNSYISFLANSQTPVKVIQKLARHSDPRLTLNTYARSFGETENNAIKQLPDVTDFAMLFCLASTLPIQSGKVRTSANNDEQENRIYEPKNTFSASGKIAPRGFEPLLPG